MGVEGMTGGKEAITKPQIAYCMGIVRKTGRRKIILNTNKKDFIAFTGKCRVAAF